MIPPLFCVVLRGSLSSLYRREREQTTEKAARPAALADHFSARLYTVLRSRCDGRPVGKFARYVKAVSCVRREIDDHEAQTKLSGERRTHATPVAGLNLAHRAWYLRSPE
jgi:hypothetical protein